MTKMLNTKAFEQWLKERAEIIVRYRQVEKSEILSEYNTLKKMVESDAFQAKKKLLTTTRYTDTEEGKTMAKYSTLKWNITVILYNLLKKDAWKEKAEVVEYLALKEQIHTPEFQQNNTFWKNNKRWFTTEESKQEQRYNLLAKHADILFFQTHTNEEVSELESYKIVWSEDFEGKQVDKIWQTGFLYPSNEFKPNHSHTAEQQAYTQGKNTELGNSVMSIVTKKQKTSAPAWHPTKGMLMHDFNYTSDIWHTAQAVAPKAGVLQAKVRIAGKAKQVMSLTTSTAKTSLPILHAESTIKGYAIHTLVWNENEIVAYLNNVEVARSKNPLSNVDLHIVLRSYLPKDQKVGNGQMDIDWIRIYTK